MNNKNALKISDLTVAYNGEPVLWDLNMAIPKGSMTAIIGPNGAGKSTLLNTILGFITPLKGEVVFTIAGTNYSSIKPIKQSLAYVPQKAAVDWDFPTTVFDVVLMGRYGHLKIGRRPNDLDRAIAQKNLEKVGMSEFSNRQISQLSGGQKQRVFLARALTEEADIYLLDEPLAGVDIKTEKIIMGLLHQEISEGKTVIAVHHDLQTIEEYFDHVVFLNHEIIDFGPTSACFTQENIEEAYRQDRIFKKV